MSHYLRRSQLWRASLVLEGPAADLLHREDLKRAYLGR